VKNDRRPPGVPEYLVAQIEAEVKRSWPVVVDPGLADAVTGQGGKPSDLVPVPAGLIQDHVRVRREAGASEDQIEKEIGYLLQVFEKACKGARDG
jgi:hypothetical protein